MFSWRSTTSSALIICENTTLSPNFTLTLFNLLFTISLRNVFEYGKLQTSRRYETYFQDSTTIVEIQKLKDLYKQLWFVG